MKALTINMSKEQVLARLRENHATALKLDEDAAKKRAENKAEMEKLLAILAEKQDGKLSALSEEQIKKRIAALKTAT